MVPDAILLQSFGGPEGLDDVDAFLANVVRGRRVPPQRLAKVKEQYELFSGRSPLNGLNRQLASAIEAIYAERNERIPVYVGNRNWHPYLGDTLRRMAADGIERAAVLTTSAYSSYSGCRQYIEEMQAAAKEVGSRSPRLFRVGPYFDQEGFIQPLADGLREACGQVPPATPVLMSAHSVPESMAASCKYESQLDHVAGQVAARAGVDASLVQVVYQSRSGSPAQPWLGPDIIDVLDRLAHSSDSVVVVPIGFVSDHMEVIYDLDVAAAVHAEALGTRLVRSATPGATPRFVEMLVGLVDALDPDAAVGKWCFDGCCVAPATRP
jgi:ferrochelatase